VRNYANFVYCSEAVKDLDNYVENGATRILKFLGRLPWVTFLGENFHNFLSLSRQTVEEYSKIKYALTYHTPFISIISELHTK